MDGILSTQERDELRTHIAMEINGNPAIMTAIISSYHFIRIPTNGTPLMYAYNIVKYCEQLAWVEDPSLILQLLAYWKHLPIFDAAHHRISSQQPPRFFPGNRPWDTVLLAVDLPFLNRKVTRRAVEHFFFPLTPTLYPAGVRALVVKGDAKSGKTYTTEYIKYVNLCYADLAFKVIWIDVKKNFSGHFGPLELTHAILDQVNEDWRSFAISFPESTSQQDARTTLQLAGIIAEQIAVTNRTHILVLDGLGEQDSRIDTFKAPPILKALIEFAQHLVTIATGEQLPLLSCDMLRIVLLGFNQPVANYLNRIRIDEIRRFTRLDIIEYFTNYLLVHPAPDISIPDVEGTADLLLNAVNPTDPDYTRKMSALALAAIKRTINKSKLSHV